MDIPESDEDLLPAFVPALVVVLADIDPEDVWEQWQVFREARFGDDEAWRFIQAGVAP